MFMVMLLACWSIEDRQVHEEEAVRSAMDRHHSEAIQVRDAIIEGDLNAARRHARRLAGGLPTPDLPDELRTMEADFAETVETLASAHDLRTAALALGTMGQNCGSCHSTVGADPYPEIAPIPTTGGTDLQLEMRRHDWAARAMWTSLVRASTTEFNSAAAVLQEAPLTPSGTQADSRLPAAATELEVRVHDLAQRAIRDTDPAKRARHYGEIIETCNTCHAAFRKE